MKLSDNFSLEEFVVSETAERLGIDREDLGTQLDADDEFRRKVYATAAALVRGDA